ncbi:unnamed protein product [Orchesella dallaii]|uniref:N-acetyltransferase domain-containing protein n=1 Tax=Orchesella dallaii TaxID=48710 RepID=A0ABP1Q848_9HEXA
MAEHVEGEWKSFVFRMAQPSDCANILAHLRQNFYRDEPLCKHVGYEDAMADEFDIFAPAALKDNLSFIAVDKATDKIAGVRITTHVRKEDKHDFPPINNKKTRAVVNVLIKLTEEANVFGKYPEITHFAEFFMVSVDRDFRGHGLASEIYERSFNMLTALKFPLIKCVFSSPYTQRIARKRGFIELGRLYFQDCKDDNGERPFPNATEDEYAVLMVKEL